MLRIRTFKLSAFSTCVATLICILLCVVVSGCGKNTLTNKTRKGVKENDTVPQYVCTKIVDDEKAILNVINLRMKAGEVVCLAPGIYNDIELSFGGSGTQKKPIVVKTQVPGTVTISGKSRIRMTGTHVVFQGFIFQNGYSAAQSLFVTGVDDIPCQYCRITENSIIGWDSSNKEKSTWIADHGKHNRIDHNWFSGKKNHGVLLNVKRSDGLPDYTVIDHNYFGNRPPAGGKAYPSFRDSGMEIILIGSSRYHETPSFTEVKYNLFENIRAETEVVSIKSSRNVFHGNTVRASYGSISNRHGSMNVFSNNFILGDGYPFAGGFRLADSGHILVNNYIEKVAYPGTRNHGAIVLMSADNESEYEPGFSGYKRVENVVIAHNTIVESVSSLLLSGGASKKLMPRNITIMNNVIDKTVGPVLTYLDQGLPPGSTISNNQVFGEELTDVSSMLEIDGFIFKDMNLVQKNGFLRAVAGSLPLVSANSRDNLSVERVAELLRIDIDGQPRGDKTDIGADQSNSNEPTNIYPLTPRAVGPKSYSKSRI